MFTNYNFILQWYFNIVLHSNIHAYYTIMIYIHFVNQASIFENNIMYLTQYIPCNQRYSYAVHSLEVTLVYADSITINAYADV